MESTLSLSREPAPRLRPLIAGTLFTEVAFVLAGPFDTGGRPLSSRLVFWLVLIGWISVKWWRWYAWAAPRATDQRTAVLVLVVGALLPNATLPLEINLMLHAIGRPLQLSWLGLYMMALPVAGLISALIAVLRGPRAVPVAQAAPAPSPLAGGPQHYLRPLVLFRMSDAPPAAMWLARGATVGAGCWCWRMGPNRW